MHKDSITFRTHGRRGSRELETDDNALEGVLVAGKTALPGMKGAERLRAVRECFRVAARSESEELCDLLTQEWIDGATRELRWRIREAFASEPAQSAERLDLARKAHAMISLSRALGLTGLAELCSRLEQRCRDDSDISAVYWAAKAAASISVCQGRSGG